MRCVQPTRSSRWPRGHRQGPPKEQTNGRRSWSQACHLSELLSATCHRPLDTLSNVDVVIHMHGWGCDVNTTVPACTLPEQMLDVLRYVTQTV